MSGRKRRTFTDEFKRDAVSLVLDEGYSLSQAARSLGVHPNQIRNWRQKFMAKKEQPKQLSQDEREELRRLRKENRRLRMERDILKKATTFFAKENQ